MVKFDKLSVGQTLWTVTRGTMGNTTIKTLYIHEARVIKLDPEKRRALISWNGNSPEWRSSLKEYRAKKPMTVTGSFSVVRMMTREEQRLLKAKGEAAT